MSRGQRKAQGAKTKKRGSAWEHIRLGKCSNKHSKTIALTARMSSSFSDVKAVSDSLMFMRPKACSAHSGVDHQAALADLASGDIGRVDGAVFTTLLVSGYAELARNKDELNTINVFLVGTRWRYW